MAADMTLVLVSKAAALDRLFLRVEQYLDSLDFFRSRQVFVSNRKDDPVDDEEQWLTLRDLDEQLPLLGGAIEHVRAGIVSTMHAANLRSAGSLLEVANAADAARVQMLFDPQTSGGLLIALSPERAAALCDALERRGYMQASIIGEVTALRPDQAVPVQVY